MAETVSLYLIDEFQDINKLQFEIKMMALPHNNLLWWEMMTSLFYRFRGSKPEFDAGVYQILS